MSNVFTFSGDIDFRKVRIDGVFSIEEIGVIHDLLLNEIDMIDKANYYGWRNG